jgi:hypothetical protein
LIVGQAVHGGDVATSASRRGPARESWWNMRRPKSRVNKSKSVKAGAAPDSEDTPESIAQRKAEIEAVKRTERDILLLPAPVAAESPEALNARLNGQSGRRVEFQAPDGRIFVVPPTEPIWAGNPVSAVLKREAQTRTRLKNGGNPNRYLRVYFKYQEDRVIDQGVPFAEYVSKLHDLDDVECVPPPASPSRAGDRAAQPDWLTPPLSLADLANRLGNIGTKKTKTVLKLYQLKNAGNRQLWTVCFDSMPPNMRAKIEGTK